jgi:poly-gamma-glutamate synthesis protein (capsule biosynthesis protein)
MYTRPGPGASNTISLLVCGDVMTGRGVDQILPNPSDPLLYEPHIRDAGDYVRLAENVTGEIVRPVEFAYIWGDALHELQRVDVRIVNLETSITASQEAWPDKEIHYRMSPSNVGCLTAARLDCCCLANNHLLDWGYAGLRETIQTLDRAGIAHAGAGRDAADAAAPAVVQVPGKGRVLVFALGSITSGIPAQWGATSDGAGVNLLPDLSEETAERVASRVREARRPGDVTVLSVHWGGNWGYTVPVEQVRFAHRLVESGVDVVHGHSSHHVKSIEVYRRRLILYGCGDLMDDYEGITPHRAFRTDVKVAYLLKVDRARGWLVQARLVPMKLERFRLSRASAADTEWLRNLVNEVCMPFGTSVMSDSDNSLLLQWQ